MFGCCCFFNWLTEECLIWSLNRTCWKFKIIPMLFFFWLFKSAVAIQRVNEWISLDFLSAFLRLLLSGILLDMFNWTVRLCAYWMCVHLQAVWEFAFDQRVIIHYWTSVLFTRNLCVCNRAFKRGVSLENKAEQKMSQTGCSARKLHSLFNKNDARFMLRKCQFLLFGSYLVRISRTIIIIYLLYA